MRISKNTPLYFLTAVTHNRLPVFRTDKMKEVLCTAFNEARISGGFLILAYVLMADHFHIITGSEKAPSEILRYLKGISARRVIGYLKENGLEGSLAKLRTETKAREYKHSLWQHNSNTFQVNTETVLLQKAHYIHSNPVEDGLVEHPNEYRYSSARIWNRRSVDNEPLIVDADKIEWRVT
ncbi:MAG: transposase [Pyrinomonadaceae bacterium]